MTRRGTKGLHDNSEGTKTKQHTMLMRSIDTSAAHASRLNLGLLTILRQIILNQITLRNNL